MHKFLLLLISVVQFQMLVAQEAPYSRCEIKGDDVYINFHTSCLHSTEEACMALSEFKEYNLGAVINSGTWALWQKDGWRLKKISKNNYQLYKKLDQFDKIFNLEDKFKIDISHWNYPISEKPAKVSSDIKDEPVVVNVRGNVEFVLKGRLNAKKVILSGSFNHWDENAIKMTRLSDGWKIRLKMPPGIYEYKFIVDGDWIHDPENPHTVLNPHDTYNSILVVGKEASFILKGYAYAKTVALSGSFNNWDKKGTPCIRTKEGWKVSQKLPPGKHFYKFIIDGQKWIVDPANDLQERDMGNNINSVIIIH